MIFNVKFNHEIRAPIVKEVVTIGTGRFLLVKVVIRAWAKKRKTGCMWESMGNGNFVV